MQLVLVWVVTFTYQTEKKSNQTVN